MQALVDEVARTRGPRAAGLVLSLLTEAHRSVDLGNGLWFLAVIVKDDGPEPVEIAVWARCRLRDTEGGWVAPELEEYQECAVSSDADILRMALELIAMEVGWVPPPSSGDEVFLLLGPVATRVMNGDARQELNAMSAVAGVRLVTVAVPEDASSRPWQTARRQVRESAHRVVAVAAEDEKGARKLIESIRDGRRPVTVVLPESNPPALVDGILAALPVTGALASTRPTPTSAPTRVRHKMVLTKVDSAPHFDVMRESGRLCSHNNPFTVTARGAPKKFAGIEKYLLKYHAGAVLAVAYGCKASGCHIVRIEFEVETPAGPVGDASPLVPPRPPPSALVIEIPAQAGAADRCP